jgi:uncharacterized coiled-coil protein SlyX
MLNDLIKNAAQEAALDELNEKVTDRVLLNEEPHPDLYVWEDTTTTGN